MISVKEHSEALKTYRFIDLFAGIGGFHYALKSFGAECVFASEIDIKAAQVYFANHKLRPYGDITKISEGQIPQHDILCAGFPCQAFSISGKQKGFEDTRGTLFFDIARIVNYHKPKILFLENVKNLVKHNKGKTLKTITDVIEKLNYTVFHKVLNTSNFGLPQNRERLYIVAFNMDYFQVPEFNFPNLKLYSKLENVLEEYPQEARIIERDDIVFYKDFNLSNNIFGEIDLPNKPIQIGKVNKGGQGERIYHPKGHAITLSAHGGGVGAKTGLYKIGNNVRKLSPRECARVQGFPDDFILPDSITEAQKQFGNSVSINTLQFILKEISKTIQVNDRRTEIRLTHSKKWIPKREKYSSEI